MSNFGTLTGKSQLIGFGEPQAFPITLDPAVYEGAVVYADNDKVYYSDGTSWIELLGGGGTTVDAILPFAFIRVDGTGNITGTGISSSNWDAVNGTMDFAFDTAQPDTDYTVVTDGELNDDGRLVSIQSKTVNGFEASFYDSNGNATTPSSASAFAIMVFASDPVTQVGQGQQGIQGTTGAQGLQGSYGPGFTIIGSVADVDSGGDPQATLNTAFPTPNTGEGVIDEADDELWIYNGTSWVNIGSFRGVQGLQGVIGPQGLQGPLGNEGIQGERGFRGFQGMQGVQGHQGVQGDLGIQGVQGFRGPQGVQGITGIQGDLGIQGIQGVQGVQGTTGIQGDVGLQGLQGFNGDDAGHVVEYRLDWNTSQADPGTGNIIFNDTGFSNTSNFSTVDTMWIDDEAIYGVNLDALYTTISSQTSTDKAVMKITKRGNPDDYVIFTIQNATDQTGYWQFNVTFQGGNALREDFTEYNGGNGVWTLNPLLVAFSIVGDEGIQGPIGPRGIQGVQGLQGPQGLQGFRGPQGTIGIQGNTGVQGDVGLQGIQGTTGIQGDVGIQGVQGTTGDFGGITYDYTYSNNTTASDPGTGIIRFDDTNLASATQMYIDDEDDNGVNVMDGLMVDLDAVSSGVKGYFKITNGADTTNHITFRIDEITNGSGYWVVDCTRLSGASSLSNGLDVRISFSRTGDQGTQGVQGTQGFRGFQGDLGLQGVQGVQGTDGLQGYRGFQGDVGNTGAQGIQGVQGTFGIQGDVGLQGDSGATGAQGIQGVQGGQGLQGLQGLQGEQGEYGGLTFQWNFVNNTIGGTDPGTNNFKFNNANPTLATLITLDDIPDDQYTTEIDDFLDFIDAQPGSVKGYLKIQRAAGGASGGPGGHHWLVYEITDWTWDGVSKNYGYFDVNYVDGNVTNWETAVNQTHGPETLITFIPRGPAGIQGAVGGIGPQGVQGPTGSGAQGVQGVQGSGGIQGADGSFGGVTFDYTFNSGTLAGDPGGAGWVKLNSATQSSATLIFIDDRDDNFIDIQPFLRTIDDSTSPVKGHVKITLKSSPQNFILFTISGLTETTGYFAIDVAHVSNAGYTFQGGDDVMITFARTGDAGATGALGPQGVQGTQGVQGDYGFQGPAGAGAQGIQGLQGTSGFQGSDGADGAAGSQGIQGIQGSTGTQGFGGFQGPGGTGAQGIQGVQGLIGQQGIAGVGAGGFQGPAGAQGIQGVQGSDGSGGTQGVQGTQGVGGAGAPGAQGPQGTQGLSGIGAQGVFGVQGAQGLQGVQGPTGAGIQGASGTGTQGIQGPQGIDGTTGTGVQGIQGFQGYQGVQGPPGTGAPGIQGYRGYQGVQGNVGGDGGGGVQGPTGPQGIQGTTGDAGTGLQGYRGYQGAQGEQGADGGTGGGGVQGEQGTQGYRGFQGNQGVSGSGSGGPQGPRGFQGTDGLSGNGIQGPLGPIGPQGTRGPQGYRGIQGIQGFTGGASSQGFTGDTGAQGFNGYQGTQGFRGFQGIDGGTGGGGIQGLQGVQGTLGFQGSQGPAGSASGINAPSIREQSNALQTGTFYPTFIEPGSGVRTLYAATTPDLYAGGSGDTNFTYNLNSETVLVENFYVDGGITLGGVTRTTWPSGGSGYDGTSANVQSANYLRFNDDIPLIFGTSSDVDFYANNTAMYTDLNSGHDWFIREGTVVRFTFDTGTGDFTAGGNVTTNSDERLKINVNTLEDALDKVKALRGVSYNKIDNERDEIGLIAQEVESILPEVVRDNADGFKSVSYGNITALLVEAIKEQQRQIDELKSK